MTNDGNYIFDRALLTRRRLRAHHSGGEVDFLYRHAGEDMLDRLSLIQRQFPVVLNLGGGRAVLSPHLRRLAGTTDVIEADAAAGLLDEGGACRVVADEEALPFKTGSLDLVVSCLALQLVNDLPGALLQMRHALRPDGLLLATLLGGRTLHELRDAMLVAESEIDGGVSPRVAPFADVRDLGALLQRAGLALPVADSDTLEVGYATPFDLMRDLKGMGWSNMLAQRKTTLTRRATLMRAAEIYAERHARPDGRITATFEIITLTGWAPHESQQQPLRPGSAKARLADALGVEEKPADSKGDGSEGG
ncbi:MAG: methyltransferase domain-containing protein [Hyphomicrobiaceae bacterium]